MKSKFLAYLCIGASAVISLFLGLMLLALMNLKGNFLYLINIGIATAVAKAVRNKLKQYLD